MIPTLLIVSGLSAFALGLLVSVLDNKRSSNRQADDYRLSSSVESVGALAAESLWSGYLQDNGGQPGTIYTFRNYLTSIGIPAMTLSSGKETPDLEEGVSLLADVALPSGDGQAQFQDVGVDALQIFRRDVGDSTQLFLSISVTSNRGKGAVDTVDRALQQVYTIEPDAFEGFDFAVLANNVNCIFCHTKVDSAERFYNHLPELDGTFDRVKVGTLETLMVRNVQGAHGTINDFDADSFIAGTLYVRGTATDHDGNELDDWSDLAFQSYAFDSAGLIEEEFGLENQPFTPGDVSKAGENLYLDYPTSYAQMADGKLPLGFPAPIPDDGGLDPVTGMPDATGAGNKVIDDNEFFAAKESAQGSITGGVMQTLAPGETIDDLLEFYSAALIADVGDPTGLQDVVEGNLILTGTKENPILIQGTLAVDGDMMISGYVKGTGTLIVRGNVYIPTDLQYLDGTTTSSQGETFQTFGTGDDGTDNALGLAAGGNILIGDYLAPATLQPDLSWELPGQFEIVDGTFDASIPAEENGWNFALAEISLFNRAEWAKTQPQVPLEDGTFAENPNYEAGYVPRYYQFGEGDMVPIYNKGNLYWDLETGTWHGDAEVATFWDPSKLTIADPNDLSDPTLYPSGGLAPVLLQVTPNADWLGEDLYKAAVEHFENLHPLGHPLRVDGLLYTNNAIFGIVSRNSRMFGQMLVNGSLVCADLGLLVPGIKDPWGVWPNHSPLSQFAIGLQLNYDKRVKDMLNVKNPYQVQLKRTIWNPTANMQ